METDQFDDLLKRMPKIAEVVNAFKSNEVQQSAFRVLVEAVGAEVPMQPSYTTDSSNKQPKKNPRKKARTKKKNDSSSGETDKSKRSGRTSLSPTNILEQLIEEGFFDEHRTLSAIIEHCRHHKAKTFKASVLSGPLGRFTRNNKLTRRKNNDKQYEYQKYQKA